jgi:hypothetical protein
VNHFASEFSLDAVLPASAEVSGDLRSVPVVIGSTDIAAAAVRLALQNC